MAIAALEIVSEYSVQDYSRMVADEFRTGAFVEALRAAVKPGAVVVEIGTGTGFFAVLACKLGARRVYAVEPGDAIQVARDVARDNGCQDRIVFEQCASTELRLAEPADVVLSDLRGVLPLYRMHLPAIVDARKRLLAPGGVLIGKRDRVFVAIVDAPELRAAASLDAERRFHDVDMGRTRDLERNMWSRERVNAEQLLAPASEWAVLDYERLDTFDLQGTLSWQVAREGALDGLAIWFDAELSDRVHFTNAPGAPELVYGNAFFPLTERVAVVSGDQVTVSLHAALIGGGYQWSWRTEVRAAAGEPKASFVQATFLGTPICRDRIRRSAANHVPVLAPDGRIVRFVLEQMAGGTRLDEIAAAARARFPERFATAKDALTHVGEISIRYGARVEATR